MRGLNVLKRKGLLFTFISRLGISSENHLHKIRISPAQLIDIKPELWETELDENEAPDKRRV